MHIVFAEDNEIIVSWVGLHADEENPHVDGAADVRQLRSREGIRCAYCMLWMMEISSSGG